VFYEQAFGEQFELKDRDVFRESMSRVPLDGGKKNRFEIATPYKITMYVTPLCT
jgi:hypothetical protein